MDNKRIAETFDQLADLLEFQGANPFRVRAYRNGARVVRDQTDPLSKAVEEGHPPLTQLDGIGKDLAGKIVTLVTEGELPQLKELLKQVPESVLSLLRIPGLGPKKAAVLHRELGIASLENLRDACQSGQVRGLSGFGAKTESAILAGIDIAAGVSERMLWADADQIARAIREHLEQCASIKQLELAGSYRRRCETVGDLDVLVESDDSEEVMDCFATLPGASQVLVRGSTKMSLRMEAGLQVDLRVVPGASFGAALQYFTGSKDHNVILRGLAKQQGMKVNEWGVYRVKRGKETYLAGATESEVYASLGLPLFPPELREARREYEWAEADELPKLIELKDIRGDLHLHTTATDGKNTLREMVDAAQGRGLKYVAITDHSQRVRMANGLDPQRLRKQWREIDKLNQQLAGDFRVLKGIECDILEKGGMDLPDDVLAEADWVLASIHYGQRQSRQQLTERILGAVEHPAVCAIAHPTGRLLNRREAYDVDMESILLAAKERGKLLELNASPRRLDLNEVHCAAAKRLGVPIVINTDAHRISRLDDLRYGIQQARRAGLTKQDVANTRTVRQLLRLVKC